MSNREKTNFAQFMLCMLVIFSVTCREVLVKYNMKLSLLFCHLEAKYKQTREHLALKCSNSNLPGLEAVFVNLI